MTAEIIHLCAPEPPPTVAEALRWWSQQPSWEPLRAATRPPVDVLDDEMCDVVLALAFRDLVAMTGLLECIGRLQVTIDAHRAQIAVWRAYDADRDGIARVERLIAVLEKWKADIINGADR